MIPENIVYVRKTGTFNYPDERPFNPSKKYPEYCFDEINVNEDNEVYDNIRRIFCDLGLDKENFNSPSWNPLGELIKPGDTVVIKPNLVMDKNGINKYNTDCLITHGSIIRAVTDYVFKALSSKGKIIIADAALQRCNFEKVAEINGINSIIKFYKNKGFHIELLDLRTEHMVFNDENKPIGIEKLSGDPRGYTAVDLKEKSMLFEVIDKYKDFRVTSYNPSLMCSHHNSEKNEYCIPNSILQADVVINLPKPKTHRKAGMTGAMKNLVGINGNKDWLPHHRKGDINIGGDEYLNKNLFKKINSDLQERIDLCTINEEDSKKSLFRFTQKVNSIFRKATSKDIYKEGSWWGNDTIWRTICDLNVILMYADKNGLIHSKKQRKCFSLLDMIISGEGEGPLLPSPKNVGMLVFGINSLAIDAILAKLMGFDYKCIPSIHKAFNLREYAIGDFNYEDITIKSNIEGLNKNIKDIDLSNFMRFKPTEGWKGHIEL